MTKVSTIRFAPTMTPEQMMNALNTNFALFENQTEAQIDASYIDGILDVSNTDISSQGWSQSCNFSPTTGQTNQVQWTSGVFNAADTNTYQISAGNTGAMTVRHYIYLDLAVSETAYQVTESASIAVGEGKVLIASAINGTTEAAFVVFGSDNMNIPGTSISAGTITGNEIAANTITAGNIAASTITAIEIDALDLTGKSLTADTGAIGGWAIDTTSITASGGGVGLDSTETDEDDIRFWAGNQDPLSAPFSVTRTGAVKASSADITGILRATEGSVIASEYLDGAIALENLDVAAQGWSQTCIFSSIDEFTVTWASGIVRTSKNISYDIDSGSTGYMITRTYIYLDVNVSTTTYQITSDATASVGIGKILIATAINGTNGAIFQVFGGSGGFNVPGEAIVANSITGNEIAANTIVADNLDVTSLSAITANLGDITSGTVTLPTGGFLRIGMTDFHEGIGLFAGTALGGGPPVLSIGNSDPDEPELTWDNTKLKIKGQFETTTPLNIKAYTTATLPGVPADTTTNSPSANANG